MKRTDFLWILPLGLLLAAGLAVISAGGFLPGWLAFSLLSILGLTALAAGWRMAGSSRTLAWVLAAAFILRLALGAGTFAFLPIIGYGSPTEKAGYLFYDAYSRDNQAWDLATSSNSLLSAFDQKQVSDQYGGMLWASAFVYRYLSPDIHRPLLITLVAALIGTLGVAFVWAAGRHYAGENIARLAALVLAFFPEAILQGAAQMREPFLMTFIAMAFYGVVEWQATRRRFAWFWVGLSLVGMLLVSPGFVLVTLVAVAGWLYFGGDRRGIPWQAVVAALGVFLLAFIVLSLSWNSLVSVRSAGPFSILGDWARETANWNLETLKHSSGIVQLLFDNFPPALRMPFVAVYGILQPVLPAAVFEPAIFFWQFLGIIRALGWYLLLPFILYAPISAWQIRDGSQRRRWLWLSLVVWVWILIASIRGGGDQWDNPRYRVILLCWQAMIAAQAWFDLRRAGNRWFIRILEVEGVLLLVFGYWYMHRYLKMGLEFGIRNTLAAAIGLSLLIVLGDWLVERLRARRLKRTA